MAGGAEPEMLQGRADGIDGWSLADAEVLSAPEISASMFDVHLAGQNHWLPA
jgi:hypothetical protein